MSDAGTQKRTITSCQSLFKWICYYPVLLRWGGFLIITQLWLSCAPILQAPLNTRFLEMRVGQLNPSAADAGILLGIGRGKRIDDRLWWQLEGNFYRASYTKATAVADTVINSQVISTKRAELDFATTIISVMVNIYYEYPLGNRFFYRASGGLGWEFIWNNEKNYVDKLSRTRTFNTPGFQISTGVGIGISRRSMIFGDLIYNAAVARSTDNSYEGGLPVYREINVSGFGFRVGINILNLKLF